MSDVETMNIFDFEELIADMLEITDNQRNEDDDFLSVKFYEKFNIELEMGFNLAKSLLMHTPVVQSGVTETKYHAFISKSAPVMLMKTKAA